MNKIKGFILILIAVGSSFVFADEVAERAKMVAALYQLVTYFALLMGIVLMVLGVVKMKKSADNKNDPKTFPVSIILTFFAGAMAFNYSGSASMMISSLLGSDSSGYCFVLNDEVSSSLDLHKENCFDASNSEIVGSLVDKVNDMSSGKGDVLKKNISIIIGLFQLIGLIYFLKGLYGLKQVSEGSSRDGYGKPIITLIASALIIDLPHTMEMLKNTINTLGIGV